MRKRENILKTDLNKFIRDTIQNTIGKPLEAKLEGLLDYPKHTMSPDTDSLSSIPSSSQKASSP